MRFEDQKLLLAWARLQAEIMVARNPTEAVSADVIPLQQTMGYRKLRAWFVRLSPRAKVRARTWFQAQIVGTREVLAKARAAGEKPNIGDIEIDVRAIEDE